MKTYMLDGPGSGSVGSDEEEFPFPQGLHVPLAARGAESSTTDCDLRVLSEKVLAAMLTDSRGCPSPGSLGIDDDGLVIGDSMPAPGIAWLTAGNEVPGDVVESVVIQVVNDKVVPAGWLPSVPGDRALTPVAGMIAGADGIEENLAMLQEMSSCRGDGMSAFLIQDAIARFQDPSSQHTAILAQGGLPCLAAR